jgi:membrane-associated PAP2 superfamily phosphatase
MLRTELGYVAPLVAVVAASSMPACSTSAATQACASVVIVLTVSAAMTAAFVAAHFLLADAPVVTSLPLLLHEQQSPDVVCSHTIYSIFSVGNRCHTQLVDELLHGMVLRSASISIAIPTCLSFFGITCRIYLTTRLSSISSLSSRRLVMSLFMRITKSSMDPRCGT